MEEIQSTAGKLIKERIWIRHWFSQRGYHLEMGYGAEKQTHIHSYA